MLCLNAMTDKKRSLLQGTCCLSLHEAAVVSTIGTSTGLHEQLDWSAAVGDEQSKNFKKTSSLGITENDLVKKLLREIRDLNDDLC